MRSEWVATPLSKHLQAIWFGFHSALAQPWPVLSCPTRRLLRTQLPLPIFSLPGEDIRCAQDRRHLDELTAAKVTRCFSACTAMRGIHIEFHNRVLEK
jgi:hypothetical protein